MNELTIKTRIPQFEVIADGMVIFSHDSYVEFSISGLTYRLHFSNDQTENAHYTKKVVGQDSSNEYMDIVFYNVPSSLFATPSNVIELGTIEGGKLCLRFSVSTIHREKESEYVLMYNWLIEKQDHERE